jgi:small glutamine-rich tetratricopeptide repeat-containing protein alpha
MDEQKDNQLALSIVQYLLSTKDKLGNNSENIDVACQCICSAFGINAENPTDFKSLSLFPTTLPEIFDAGVAALDAKTYESRERDMNGNSKFPAFVETVAKRGYFEGADPNSIEYLKRHAKVMVKFQNKVEQKSSEGSVAAPSKAAMEAQAEEKKLEGNNAIAKKDHQGAAKCYSEAIALSPDGPNSHIYYCNRAAAYCHLGNYDQAAHDCENSLALKPDYVKAYSRLGLACFFLEQFERSIDAYEKCVELEPGVKSHQDALTQAKQKLQSKQQQLSEPAGMGGAGGGMPDLSALAGMLGGAGGGGIASMLQNPAMMQAAQKMMQNPAMMAQAQAMMQNPAMMEQAMKMMGGGGGGMPDLSALAGMMGGGASNSNSGIPSFSGFES